MNKIFLLRPFKILLKLSGLVTTVIDIGNAEIRLLEAFRLGSRFFLLRFKSVKKPPDLNNGQKFEELLKKLGLSRNSSFTLTFSLSSINAIPLSFPGIPREKLASMLDWELEKKLPLPLKDVRYAYKIMENKGAGGRRDWNITALILKNDEVQSYISLFKRSGRTIDRTYLLPPNILNIFNSNVFDGAPGFIVWGDQTVEIYIFQDKRLCQFILYSGHFSELNKIAVRNITGYLQSFQERTGRPLDKIILFNKSGIPGSQIKEAVVKNMNVSVSEIGDNDLSHAVRKADPEKAFYDLAGFVRDPDRETEISSPALKKQYTAGLILKTAARALVLLTFLSIIFIPFIINTENDYTLFLKAKNTPAQDDRNESVKKLSVQIRQVEELKLLMQKQDELIKKIDTIKNSGFVSSHLRIILMEIARIIPEDVRLKSLRITGAKGEMEGYSRSSGGLDQFVGSLGKSGRLKDIMLNGADLAQENGKSILSFKISFGAGK